MSLARQAGRARRPDYCRAAPASTPGSLGFSFVDIGRKAGTLATVFADRVQALAAIAGVDDGELLGRVIAHEIAHLLIGTSRPRPSRTDAR